MSLETHPQQPVSAVRVAEVVSAKSPVVPEPLAARRRAKIDPRYIAPIFVTIILLAAHFSAGVLESPGKMVLAVATAIALEVLLGRLMYGRIPHLASAYVSGNSVALLMRSPYYWPYALCSAITITSKYVLRVKDRHIWNPSNFGIAAMLFLAPQSVASLSIQFGNSVWPMIIIWIVGFYLIARLRRLHICATYVVSFLVFGVLRSAITGHPLSAEIAPITGPMYQLFVFFMITDPKTTVRGYRGQILVTFLIALVEAGLRLVHLVHAPYYALFIVGPLANLVEIKRDSRRSQAQPAAAPSTGACPR
jgi:enediyne biosynthesis protein E5